MNINTRPDADDMSDPGLLESIASQDNSALHQEAEELSCRCEELFASVQRKDAELAVLTKQLTEANIRLHEQIEINHCLKARIMALGHPQDKVGAHFPEGTKPHGSHDKPSL